MPPESSCGYWSATRFGSGIPTLSSISTATARASFLLALRWIRTTSMIWLPMVWSGEKELMGSWNIMAISSPRIWRISLPLGSNWAMSTAFPCFGECQVISPDSIVSVFGSRRMIDWAVTLLPQPLSPTNARISPAFKVRLISSTMVNKSPSVSTQIRKLRISSRVSSRIWLSVTSNRGRPRHACRHQES